MPAMAAGKMGPPPGSCTELRSLSQLGFTVFESYYFGNNTLLYYASFLYNWKDVLYDHKIMTATRYGAIFSQIALDAIKSINYCAIREVNIVPRKFNPT